MLAIIVQQASKYWQNFAVRARNFCVEHLKEILDNSFEIIQGLLIIAIQKNVYIKYIKLTLNIIQISLKLYETGIDEVKW